MPRCREDLNKWSNKDFRRLAIKFFISPIWLAVEMCSSYTHVSQFLLTNLAFFHCAFITAMYGEIKIILEAAELADSSMVILVLFCFLIVYAVLWTYSRCFAKLLKPSVQKMSQMIIGLFGMILSVWSIMASLILMDFKFDLVVATCILYTSCITLCFSYLLFSSALTTLYIRLPAEEMPFSGVKFYVVFFAVFHLGVAMATVHLSKSWLICLLLTASSFVFCCDVWACLFTSSYMLCEHRQEKLTMKLQPPAGGVIYKIAVKRIYEKCKLSCPTGFQFDEDLIVENVWRTYDDSEVNICFWT